MDIFFLLQASATMHSVWEENTSYSDVTFIFYLVVSTPQDDGKIIYEVSPDKDRTPGGDLTEIVTEDNGGLKEGEYVVLVVED